MSTQSSSVSASSFPSASSEEEEESTMYTESSYDCENSFSHIHDVSSNAPSESVATEDTSVANSMATTMAASGTSSYGGYTSSDRDSSQMTFQSAPSVIARLSSIYRPTAAPPHEEFSSWASTDDSSSISTNSSRNRVPTNPYLQSVPSFPRPAPIFRAPRKTDSDSLANSKDADSKSGYHTAVEDDDMGNSEYCWGSKLVVIVSLLSMIAALVVALHVVHQRSASIEEQSHRKQPPLHNLVTITPAPVATTTTTSDPSFAPSVVPVATVISIDTIIATTRPTLVSSRKRRPTEPPARWQPPLERRAQTRMPTLPNLYREEREHDSNLFLPRTEGSTSVLTQNATDYACPPSFRSTTPLPGKRGVALTLRAEGRAGSWRENLPKVELLKGYWNYGWGLNRIDAQPEHVEFVPMLWGPRNKSILQVRELLHETVMASIKKEVLVRHFLGFNEPDKEGQANMSVDKAIELWPTIQETIPNEIALVSPSCAMPLGVWMQAFMQQAEKLCYRIDWIGVHWYGRPNVKQFQTYMKEIYDSYGGRPLLITEFAVADYQAETASDNRYSTAQVLRFARQVLPWLERQDWVMGYAWFPFDLDSPVGTCSALLNRNGKLTTLGKYYASVTTENILGDRSIIRNYIQSQRNRIWNRKQKQSLGVANNGDARGTPGKQADWTSWIRPPVRSVRTNA